MNQCRYDTGSCNHGECEWYNKWPTSPTVEDYCAAGGHSYNGDDWYDEDTIMGRCYCGEAVYPKGGHEPIL